MQSHAGSGGFLIFGVLFVLDVQAAFAGEEQSVARGAGGQHAIHHVHAHARVLLDLVGVADAHHVARLVFGQQRQGFGIISRVSSRGSPTLKPADGVAVEVHLHQALGALAAQIGVHAALDDAKEAACVRRRGVLM
jgi:hypothetical protein